MLDKIKQRLQSKTYLTALALGIVSLLEINAPFVTSFIPEAYRGYLLMIWPIAMMTLREVTTGALSDK